MIRPLRAFVVSAIALVSATCAPLTAHAQDQTTNRNTIVAPVVKFPAICLADSLKKKSVAQATRDQCAAIKAHVDSANRQLTVARSIKITGRKTPPGPTTHPPVVPPATPDTTSPVDTITPVILPVPMSLAIVTQPGDAASGSALSPQPVVKIVDQFGATSSASATITASLSSGLVTLTGALAVPATNGVAVFSTLGATTATTGANAITFSAPGFPSVTSTSFTVTAPPPPPPPPNPPTIASFIATPSSIGSAGNVTLAWSVSGSGTIALSLAPGFGAVTGTSRTVAVTATTTYTLTATNSAGSTSASTTVTLVPPSGLPATPVNAELPRAIVDATYPTPTRSYAITAGTNFQTALDTAKLGDEIRIPTGSTWTGTFTLRKKTSGSGTITLRANLTDGQLGAPGVRMRPSVAAALQLPKFQTATANIPVFGTADSAHHYRLVGLEITNTGAVTSTNQLVRLGDAASNGQTVLANVPGDFVIDRSYIHAGTTTDIRRCVTLHSTNTAVVDSWIAECHSNNGDAQAILGYNGPGPFYIRNNYLEASHEVVVWGGGDPFSAAFSPADVTLVYNHISRPDSWKGSNPYAAGQWQEKNGIETKNVCRYLIQGNVIEHAWKDAQDGFGLLLKSTNQDGTAPYSQTCDVTVRFNLFQFIANGAILNGRGSDPTPDVLAARLTLHDNLFTGINTGIYSGDGKAVALVGSVVSPVLVHNTFVNSGSSLNAIAFDGTTISGLVFDSNVLYKGSFGVKGPNRTEGNPSLAAFAPSASFQSNAIIGAQCSIYPATTQCPSTIGGVTGNGPDGRPLGADMSAVNGQTAGVVVAP